jgi:hypothetical protein
VSQIFGSREEVKQLVKRHAIESRKSLSFLRNDKDRIRVVCEGHVAKPIVFDGPGGSSKGNDGPGCVVGSTGPQKSKSCVLKSKQSDIDGSGGQKRHKLRKDRLLQVDCPWVLHISKLKAKEETWAVKTYNPTHTCLNSRVNLHLTAKFMSQEDWMMKQVETNPNIPIKHLQQEAAMRYELNVSKMKAFRAKAQARQQVEGDYKDQYARLRDYLLELMQANPGTTAKIDVENEGNTDDSTRIFKRVYICLGALKEGFKECGRELLGLDGAFMKGPYPGQLLTAVGLDPNNGIYPLAYVVVEAENKESWI